MVIYGVTFFKEFFLLTKWPQYGDVKWVDHSPISVVGGIEETLLNEILGGERWWNHETHELATMISIGKHETPNFGEVLGTRKLQQVGVIMSLQVNHVPQPSWWQHGKQVEAEISICKK